MYTIEDRESAIKTVQRYLSLNQSGVYDQKTREAVTAFQAQNGILPTGITDYITFVALWRRYQAELVKKQARSNAPQMQFPATPGDSGTAISALNASITEALLPYTFSGITPRGRYYNVYTSDAVIRLRQIFGYEEVDTVDEALYERIEREIFTHLR